MDFEYEDDDIFYCEYDDSSPSNYMDNFSEDILDALFHTAVTNTQQDDETWWNVNLWNSLVFKINTSTTATPIPRHTLKH